MLDLLVRDALVVDGRCGAPFVASVGVADRRIVSIDRGEDARARDGEAGRAAGVVNADGLVIAPGFIDVHTHSDVAPFTDSWMDSALRQGVTTVVVGNCGMSAWPREGLPELASFLGIDPEVLPVWREFGEYLDAVDRARPACNVAVLVGFGSLRTHAMGHEPRAATAAEIGVMRQLLDEAMQAGALGMSSGLEYVPGMYATAEEVAAVVAAAAPYGGLYATHKRAEGQLVFDAVREAAAIAQRGGVHGHVSHLKLASRCVWGQTDELLALIDATGLTADQYPYVAWESSLASFLPPWAPVDKLPTLLADSAARARLARVIEEGEPGWESSVADFGWESIVLEATDASLADRDMASVAAERGVAPVDLTLDLLCQDPGVRVRGRGMDEDDVRAILARPDILVASDGIAVSPEGPLWGTPLHPRSYGAFPRVLGRYVREGALLSLEAAVRKMTALPAETFGLSGRGVIAEGAIADLVLFDPATVADRAEFGDTHRYPEGVAAVIVNGRVAWDGERRERAGRVLRRG
jgi:dihydroorotase/N-acyl-D-amino-acid deacylase